MLEKGAVNGLRTERRSNEDVPMKNARWWTDTQKNNMADSIVWRGDQLHSLTTEEMVRSSRSRERPRRKYVGQIIKDTGVTCYWELKDTAFDEEK